MAEAEFSARSATGSQTKDAYGAKILRLNVHLRLSLILVWGIEEYHDGTSLI